MTHIHLSPLAQKIVDNISGQNNIGSALYFQLVLRQEALAESDVWAIVDYFKQDAIVIEATIRSGVLSQKSACRLLQLFRFKPDLTNLAELTYDDPEFTVLIEQKRALAFFSKVLN